jgi:hypothetical protein
MINFLLKAKHWQVFILLLGIPLIFQCYNFLNIFSDINAGPDSNNINYLNSLSLFPIVMILTMGSLFAWFWSLAIGLNKKIPDEFKLITNKFKFFFFFPLIYLIILMLFIAGKFNGIQISGINIGNWVIVIILPLHLVSMFGMFHTLYYVAKTIKTVELKRKVAFGDFVLEFFLLWFYFIGIWIIQPKVNRL